MALVPMPFKADAPGIDQKEISIAIMGPPGAGKSSLLGTMEGRGFVLNILPGERGAPIVLAHLRDRIIVKSVREWSEIQPIYEWLKQGTEKTGIDWFGLDSWTALGEQARRRTLKERAERGISADPAQMSIQDWGRVGGFLQEALFRFLSLPYTKVFVTQERRYEADGLETSMGPDTRPAILGFFLQSMSGIVRIYSVPIGGGKFERRLQTAQHPNMSTKFQSLYDRPIPNVIKNPNLGQLLGYSYSPEIGKYTMPEGVDEQAESDNLGLVEL